MRERICTKPVYNITDPYFCCNLTAKDLIDEFVSDSLQLKSKSIKPTTIDLCSAVSGEDFLKKADDLIIKDIDKLSFEVTDQDIIRLSNQIIKILRDPNSISKYLKPLDQEVGEKMKSIDIEFDHQRPESLRPEFLITGRGYFIAGPAPKGYKPLKKRRALDEILLEHEMHYGINSEGVTAKFVGPVKGLDAAKFVKDGHTFGEDEQVSILSLHGKYSHRLALEIIRQAVEMGDLNFTLDSGEQLTQIQFLEMLNTVRVGLKDAPKDSRVAVLWEMVIDNLRDTMVAAKYETEQGELKFRRNLLNHDNYSYSALSPFVLKSLLTCFGDELELPNLQSYLLDNHWKQIEQMKLTMIEQDEKHLLKKIPDDDFYTYLMISLSTPTSSNPGDLGCKFPFTLTPSRASLQDKYQPFHSDDDLNFGIRKKDRPSTSFYSGNPSHYESLENYRACKLSKTSQQQ